MRCKPCDRNAPVGNGGQGRNRTIDTRIFSSSESPARREEVEDRKRVFAAPTEPNSPTELIPNPARAGRPSRAVSSRDARASTHRDRTRTEPWPLSPVGLPAVFDRRIVPFTRRSRHAHLAPPAKRTHRSNSPPAWVHSRATSDRDVAKTLARRRAFSRKLPSPRPIRVSRRPVRARPVESQRPQRFAR
jgi:hypothetical protein